MRPSLYGVCVGLVSTLALGVVGCDSGSSSEPDGADQAGGAAMGGSGAMPSPPGTGTTSAAGTPPVGSNAAGSSAGGASAAGSPANVIVSNPPSSYPQNALNPTARFPYPQGHASAYCKPPAYNTDKVQAAYGNWKSKFFQGDRIIRPENMNDIVSEGIAYGMLIGVYMNDKALFDALWNYARTKRNGNGFMGWHQGPNGGTIDGGGATDADEDMAYALAMAAVQWGGDYQASAITLINAIWDKEVEGGSNVLKPGDNFGGSNQTNPSYFAPSYYRVYAKLTPNHNWMAVLDTTYRILTAAAGTTGLVPNWVNAQGSPVNGPGNDANGPYYGYDACRTPFRIALDYCESGEPRAKAYLEKLVTFYQTTGGARLTTLKDGYTTSGGNPPGTLGDYAAGMAFYGPGGVAAMVGGHEALLTSAYSGLALNTTSPTQISSGNIFSYFNGSWGTLSLLVMSGNFWSMTE